MPGPPRDDLPRGTTVTLFNRPPQCTGAGRGAVTWLAIAPPPGEVRYVRANALALPGPKTAPAPGHSEPRAETLARFEPPAPSDPSRSPSEVADEVARVEAEHRSALDAPVEQWRLDRVRSAYESLLKRTSDPAAAALVRARLDLVARHEEVARSARAFATILERSRRRDRSVATTLRRLAAREREGPQTRPYAAEGLVQPSSREVDGRRVYALIGPEGAPVAYLDIPPGLDARPALSRRVGVRGSVRFDPALGTRLIAVRDLETLD
jgi:hypothetical protein